MLISNAELDRFIAEVRVQPLAEGELRPVAEGAYVSLSQSQPEGLDGFCLSAGGRLYFFWETSCGSAAPSPLLERFYRNPGQ